MSETTNISPCCVRCGIEVHSYFDAGEGPLCSRCVTYACLGALSAGLGDNLSRQEICAEIEAAHLEREMKLAADLDAAKAALACAEEQRDSATERNKQLLAQARADEKAIAENQRELSRLYSVRNALQEELACAEEQRDSATERNKQLLGRCHEAESRIAKCDALVRENLRFANGQVRDQLTIRDLTSDNERIREGERRLHLEIADLAKRNRDLTEKVEEAKALLRVVDYAGTEGEDGWGNWNRRRKALCAAIVDGAE